MADRKQTETSKIDALYSWISYDLQKMKSELMNEMKYSSVQMGSLYQEIKSDKDKSSQAISQEIRYSYKQNQTIYDGLAKMLTEEVGDRLNSMDEKVADLEELQKAIQNAVADVVSKLDEVQDNVADAVKAKVDEVLPQLEEAVGEIKYGYVQQQAIYDGLTTLIQSEVIAKLNDADAKLAMLEQIDRSLVEIQEKIAEGITLYEDNDYKAVIESVAEKTEESVAEHSRQVLEAVAAIPVAENVDYTRIVDEVGDKVLDLLGEIVLPQPKEEEPVEAKVDYDKIVYGTAEKVVESLPYPEKVNYRRIDESFVKAAEKVQVQIAEETLSAAVATMVEKALASLDLDALAASVAEKVQIPVVEAPEIDYERLSDMVAAKVVVPEVDYERLSEMVAAKIAVPEVNVPEIDYDLLSDMVVEKLAPSVEQTYDVVLDEAGIDQIAERVSEKLDVVESTDYARIANIVEEKLNEKPCEPPTYELVVDEEGVQAIAKTVAEELCQACSNCAAYEETTEEPVEEVAEEPTVAEEPETQEEDVEETTEEPVEEVVEEPTVAEELAVAAEPAYNELEDQLVDAETGLVVRLKRSFTAKMKQSEDRVKQYYSDIKNELTSYKRINSNVSWHGDRFNFGRDTIAKVNICGKTLCFYLALDPEDPEYKTTVYHQKNVGAQKAYENTPFMVKIKSDAAAKKALRLVGFLAEKLGTTKEEGFEAVNYVDEFGYESTKQLFDEGYIKATKEKKVELDF